MSAHHRNRPTVLKILLIVWLFLSSSIAIGQYAEVAVREPVESPSSPTLHKFTFKHAKAADARKIQAQLSGDDNLGGVAVDERTNSLIYLVDEQKAREIEAFYTLLDAEPSAPASSENGVSISIPALGPKPLAFDFSIGFVRDDPIDTLKQRYNELEQQAHQLADKCKQSNSLSDSQRSELKLAVRKSFEARQALQRAEIADLAQRMKGMQQSIEMRDKLADKVVERRVEDLLNPDLKWDASHLSERKASVTDKSTTLSAKPPNASSTSIEEAVSRLLSQQLPPVDSSGKPTSSPIAIVGVEYSDPYEAGDLKEEILDHVYAQVDRSSLFNSVSRRNIDATLIASSLKLRDLREIETRDKLLLRLRGEGVVANYLLFITLNHTAAKDEDLGKQFQATFELTDGFGGKMRCVEHVSLYTGQLAKKSGNDYLNSLKGRWIVKSWVQESKDDVISLKGQMELRIEGDVIDLVDKDGNHLNSMVLDEQNIVPDAYKRNACPVNFVFDPNGDRHVCPGIIELDGDRLRICFNTSSVNGDKSDKFRPSLFIPGSKVLLIECSRTTTDPVRTSGVNNIDLSTPQATLDHLHRISIENPDVFPSECYTEEAILELSGVMLQQLCMMSGLSQMVVQNDGTIGSIDDLPILPGTTPSFHYRTETLLQEHMLTKPPEVSKNAFELLIKLTLGAALSHAESLVKPDREMCRLAAGTLKSPKKFLADASKLMKSFGSETSATDPRKKSPPKYNIAIDGDNATATTIEENGGGAESTIPISFKLLRVNGQWLVSQTFSDEILTQILSSMSQVLAEVSESDSEKADFPDVAAPKAPGSAEGARMVTPHEWNDFSQVGKSSGNWRRGHAVDVDSRRL